MKERGVRGRHWLMAQERKMEALMEGTAMEPIMRRDYAKRFLDKTPADPTSISLACYLVSRAIAGSLPKQKPRCATCDVCRYRDVRKINQDILRMAGENNTGGVTKAMMVQLGRKYPFTRNQLQMHAATCIPLEIYHYMMIAPFEGEMDQAKKMIDYILETLDDSKVIRDKAIESGQLAVANENLVATIAAASKVGVMTGEFRNPDAKQVEAPQQIQPTVQFFGMVQPAPPPDLPQRKQITAKIEEIDIEAE